MTVNLKFLHSIILFFLLLEKFLYMKLQKNWINWINIIWIKNPNNLIFFSNSIAKKLLHTMNGSQYFGLFYNSRPISSCTWMCCYLPQMLSTSLLLYYIWLYYEKKHVSQILFLMYLIKEIKCLNFFQPDSKNKQIELSL